MWEGTLEKLKILDYENDFLHGTGRKPFSRIYFVFPHSNQSVQFDDFIDLCIWLCGKIPSKGRDPFIRDQYDDPNTVASKLMIELRELQFKLSVPATKLKIAHGEAICSVLDFLSDKVLAEKKFRWCSPVYPQSEKVYLSYYMNPCFPNI